MSQPVGGPRDAAPDISAAQRLRRVKRKKWLGVSLIWVGGLLLVVFLLVAAFLLVEPNSVDDYSVQEPPVGANPGAVPYEQRPVQDLDDAESELAALENALEAYPAETLPKAVAALNAISIVVTMATNEATSNADPEREHLREAEQALDAASAGAASGDAVVTENRVEDAYAAVSSAVAVQEAGSDADKVEPPESTPMTARDWFAVAFAGFGAVAALMTAAGTFLTASANRSEARRKRQEADNTEELGPPGPSSVDPPVQAQAASGRSNSRPDKPQPSSDPSG